MLRNCLRGNFGTVPTSLRHSCEPAPRMQSARCTLRSLSIAAAVAFFCWPPLESAYGQTAKISHSRFGSLVGEVSKLMGPGSTFWNAYSDPDNGGGSGGDFYYAGLQFSSSGGSVLSWANTPPCREYYYPYYDVVSRFTFTTPDAGAVLHYVIATTSIDADPIGPYRNPCGGSVSLESPTIWTPVPLSPNLGFTATTTGSYNLGGGTSYTIAVAAWAATEGQYGGGGGYPPFHPSYPTWGSAMILWSFDNMPLPGATKTKPIILAGGLMATQGKKKDGRGDNATGPANGTAVNLVAPTSGSYGVTNSIFAGPASGTSAQPIAAAPGINFESLGPKITTFTIPDTLPNGDATFTVSFNGFTQTLNAGATIDFTSLVPGGVSNFHLAGFSPGLQLAQDNAPPFVWGATYAADGLAQVNIYTVPNWTGPGGGTYGQDSNWTTGSVANGVDTAANFLENITAPSTVTLNSDLTLGTLNFSSTNSYTLSGTGSLTMQVSTGTASINVFSGSHEIAVPVVLASDTVINGPGSLNLSAGISGPHALTVLGNLTTPSINVDQLVIGTGGATAVPEASTVALLFTACVGGLLWWPRRC
jgi:hypothetical protein